MRRRYVLVIGWYFVMLMGSAATQVGPFQSERQCVERQEYIRSVLRGSILVPCWSF